ncbi:hypothetical protein [Porphyromonas circumdentaria]|uniref:Uncharacterized protein n=1 Tax=Porphyromonas circumdentaria TaxID=29524 RepID=A0A1T4PWB2_9PORP|nr:hypothetical protein [Porphyromonas circumdentaria]MBB6276558.1 thiol-disulfide isomerase/thioredoxin [Porphyromonas circumdentaria]MDO4722364.1 hypothetical protein [Porphyromonas circumdentaria]SJZ95597.1 hypothetical protein SAMN02745171_01605 [Porphyromonas circumdentaria]
MSVEKKKFKLLYPDSLYDLDSISCTTFMYFQEEPFATTLHPTVSMGLTGFNPTLFLDYINKKNPSWIKNYWMMFNSWDKSEHKLHKTSNLLKPLRDLNISNSVWLVYSKNEGAIEKAKELISLIGIDYKTLLGYINIEQAFQELMAHIHFEKFVELYGVPPKNNPLSWVFEPRKINYSELYRYCDSFFRQYTLEEALVNAYFTRLINMESFESIMLSNENLMPLLKYFNNNQEVTEDEINYYDQLDVISWEIFRQLLSPYIDEIEQEKRVKATLKIIRERNEEITRFRNKCWVLAEDFRGSKKIESLERDVAKHIKINAIPEIQELLKLDSKAFSTLMDRVFSDEKTWVGIATYIISVFSENEILTAGSAIYALSSLGSKSFSTLKDIQNTINQSDYSLIYRLKN